MDQKPSFYALVLTFAMFSPSIICELYSKREIVAIHCLPFDLERKISFCVFRKETFFTSMPSSTQHCEILTELQMTFDSLSSRNEKRSLPAWCLPADREHRLPVVPSVASGAERPPSSFRLRGLNGPALLLARFLHPPGVFRVWHCGERETSAPKAGEDNGALDPLKKSVDCLLPKLPLERPPSRIHRSLRLSSCCPF